MAGYMRKLNGHIYDGANKATEALTNGLFVEITAGGVAKLTAASDVVLRVVEKTTLWGEDALVCDVAYSGTDEVFFVENEWDIHDNEDYDTAKYTCKIGDYVRMHRPQNGEQLIFTVGSALYAALSVGDSVKPTTGGTVAKVA